MKAILGKVIVFLLLTQVALAEDNLLQKIDNLRLPKSQSYRLGITIDTSNGINTKYTVDSDGKGNSIAEVITARSRGEKYLFTKRGLWISFPGSRRTIRIPKIQQLRGETVVGDLNRLRLSSEYTTTHSEKIMFQDIPATYLELTAQNRRSTFRAIKLWINAETLHPLYAEYYLTSGKLFRKAHFAEPQRMNVGDQIFSLVSQITYSRSDGLQSTIFRIVSIEPRSFPNGYFSSERLRR